VSWCGGDGSGDGSGDGGGGGGGDCDIFLLLWDGMVGSISMSCLCTVLSRTMSIRHGLSSMIYPIQIIKSTTSCLPVFHLCIVRLGQPEGVFMNVLVSYRRGVASIIHSYAGWVSRLTATAAWTVVVYGATPSSRTYYSNVCF